MHIISKTKITFIVLFTLLSMCFVLPYSTTAYSEVSSPANSFYALKCPTYITKIGSDYFICDCYNNQIIYNSDINAPINQWKVMTSDLKLGHTIASDGKFYVVDDTENHKVKVFMKNNTSFVLTQTFDNIGTRPHFVYYDYSTQAFYVLSSMTGELFIFQSDGDQLVKINQVKIHELNGLYVRSFTFIGDKIYFAASNMSSEIIVIDKTTFEVTDKIAVPDCLAGMVQIFKHGKYYYLTISTNAGGNQMYGNIVRTQDLNLLSSYEYEEILHYFTNIQPNKAVVPYFITSFDNKFYMTESKDISCIWEFDIIDDEITNVRRAIG